MNFILFPRIEGDSFRGYASRQKGLRRPMI